MTDESRESSGTVVDYSKLVDRFARANRADRAKLEQELIDGGPLALSHLAGAVIAESQQRRTVHRWIAGGALIFIAIFGLIAFVSRDRDAVRMMSYSGLILGSIMVAAASKLQRKSVTVLASFEDVRAVGALAEMLDVRDNNVQKEAIEGLKKLLPRMTASDSRLLTSDQRTRIQAFLNPRRIAKHGDFIEVILKAWIQVGDETAIPAVRSLAEMPDNHSSRTAIKQAANECLTVLERRAEERRMATTLLRAAESPDSESLLRPAEHTSSVDPNTLLRPINRGL